MPSSPVAIARPEPTAGRWKHGAIPVIGLTGGIGAGKSRVAELLKRKGAFVIDADSVGHEVLEEPEVRGRVVARFGPRVLLDPSRSAPGEGGHIDRPALGSIVFSDQAALRDLEAIVHPPMCRRFETIIAREAARGVVPAVVLDAAILLETGWDRVCDLVVFVDAPPAVRLERVSRTRGWTAEGLKSREAAQWPVGEKRDRADVVLPNDSSVEALEVEVEKLFRSLSGEMTIASRRPEGAPRSEVPEPMTNPREAATLSSRTAPSRRM